MVLLKFSHHVQGRQVLIKTDNIMAKAYVNKGWAQAQYPAQGNLDSVHLGRGTPSGDQGKAPIGPVQHNNGLVKQKEIPGDGEAAQPAGVSTSDQQVQDIDSGSICLQGENPVGQVLLQVSPGRGRSSRCFAKSIATEADICISPQSPGSGPSLFLTQSFSTEGMGLAYIGPVQNILVFYREDQGVQKIRILFCDI